MDDALKIAREISREHDKSTIVLLIIMIIIYILFNLVIPIILTKVNHKNEINKLRAERKLDSIETLVKELRLLSSFLSISDYKNIEDGKKKINELRKIVQSNDLLFTKELSDHASELLDYYAVVLISSEKRDVNSEKKLFNEIKKDYEKIV